MVGEPTIQRTREPASRGLQNQIKQLILDRGLRPGEPMPTEAELLHSLGVSRNSVREALKALQALDIVQIRHGFGTYVGPVALDPFTDGLTFRTLLTMQDNPRAIGDLLDVRETLEVGLLRSAATALRDADLDALTAVVERMYRRAEAGENFPEEDREFHDTLFRPLGNALVSELLASFWEVYHRVSPQLPDEPEPAQVADWHQAIAAAIRDRDVARAEVEMRRHFAQIRQRIAAA